MEGKPKELVGVINILFHDDQPGHMLFQGPGYHHWISEDFGKTYVAIETPGKTLGYGSQLKLHPTQPDWVLARVRRNECLKVRLIYSEDHEVDCLRFRMSTSPAKLL